MSTAPEDFTHFAHARRAARTQAAMHANDPPPQSPEEQAYRKEVEQAEQWARRLGPLATAKNVETTVRVVNDAAKGTSSFPVWLLISEYKASDSGGAADLSKTPSAGTASGATLWSGVILDRKGKMFYFENSPDTTNIPIGAVMGILTHETVTYRSLESIDDLQRHTHGIDAIKTALADFAIDNGLAEG